MTPYRRNLVDAVSSELGAAQHGVLAGHQLRARSVSMAAVRHRVERGRLIRLKRDVFRLPDHPWTWEAQLQAALLDGGPGSVVSHRSAARLHGFWRYRAADVVEITVHEFHDHLVTLGKAHRSALLPRSQRTIVAGFPATTVARTCFDLIGDPDVEYRRRPGGRELHARVMRRVLNDAIARHGLTLGQFAAVRASIAKRGRPGSALARELVKRLGPNYVPLTSEGEMLVAELIDDFDLPQPDRQAVMSDDEGWIGNVDFLWRASRLVLEVDGRTHDGPLDIEDDAQRDERLTALGYDVWRWKYRELVGDPSKHLRRLADRLASTSEPRVESDVMASTSIQHSQGKAS